MMHRTEGLSADMKFLKNVFVVVAGAMVSASPYSLPAQNVDAAMLLKPPADSWPSYHGDYTGKRHSALTEITPKNVQELWTFHPTYVQLGCIRETIEAEFRMVEPLRGAWSPSGHR